MAIAEKTTENYTRCIAKFNKFAATNARVPVYAELRKDHLLEKGDEQLGLRNILHNFAQWLVTERQANGQFYAPGTTLHFFSDFMFFAFKAFFVGIATYKSCACSPE